MSKYKVGDKVVVRKDLTNTAKYGGVYVTPSMEQWYGKEKTIESINSEGHYLLKDIPEWEWTDEMLEDTTEFPEGSIICSNKCRRKVLGVCGEVRFLSPCMDNENPDDTDFDRYIITLSVLDLKDSNYKLCTPETSKPKLTHKQLEEKLGYEFELEDEE